MPRPAVGMLMPNHILKILAYFTTAKPSDFQALMPDAM
jgi:hypothetical protein